MLHASDLGNLYNYMQVKYYHFIMLGALSKPLYSSAHPPGANRHNVYDTSDLKTTKHQLEPSGRDPLNPDYKLPSYEPTQPEETR